MSGSTCSEETRVRADRKWVCTAGWPDQDIVVRKCTWKPCSNSRVCVCVLVNTENMSFAVNNLCGTESCNSKTKPFVCNFAFHFVYFVYWKEFENNVSSTGTTVSQPFVILGAYVTVWHSLRERKLQLDNWNKKMRRTWYGFLLLGYITLGVIVLFVDKIGHPCLKQDSSEWGSSSSPSLIPSLTPRSPLRLHPYAAAALVYHPQYTHSEPARQL